MKPAFILQFAARRLPLQKQRKESIFFLFLRAGGALKEGLKRGLEGGTLRKRVLNFREGLKRGSRKSEVKGVLKACLRLKR